MRMRGNSHIYNKSKLILRFVLFHKSSREIFCKMHLILSQMYVGSFSEIQPTLNFPQMLKFFPNYF